MASTEKGDTVLDPFSGSGTTGVSALLHDRNYTGLELNEDYHEIASHRIKDTTPFLLGI